MVAFLRDLIRIPSPTCGEGPVVDRVEQEMRSLGLGDIIRHPVGHIVARLGSGRGRTILFDAHLDTVGPGDLSLWDNDPYEGKVEKGFVYGRGASDNKGAMAAMLYGVKMLLEAGVRLRGTLYIAGSVMEEDAEGLAATFLCRDLKPDAVILGEATELNVYRGQRGRMEIAVQTYGRSCHGSAPERGVNAIYLMNRIIDGIQALAPSLPTDPFLGKATVAVTAMEARSGSLNVIPDVATIYIDRRLTPGESEDTAVGQVEAIARTVVGTRPTRVWVPEYTAASYTGYVCRQRKYFPAWALPEDHELVQIAADSVERALGRRPAIGRWLFSTNGVGTMGVLGIPTVGFGPGSEDDAHTTDDKISIADLVAAARGYAQLACDLVGKED